MDALRNLTIVAGAIAAVGGLLCGAAVVATFAVGFEGGANIGAGILLLFGMPTAILGGLLLIVALVGTVIARLRRSLSR